MFAAHFGLAAAVKAKQPQIPLWALMLGTQLLDVVFVPLFVAGVETMESVSEQGYGGAVIHADYTHSLLGALIISWLALLWSARMWGKSAGRVVGATVFSHWMLDLIVHREDMPILPGNWGELPLLGLGVWSLPWAAACMEAIIIAIGAVLYFRYLRVKLNNAASSSALTHKDKILTLSSGLAVAFFLILSLVTDMMGVG